jgi:hypothetical protein
MTTERRRAPRKKITSIEKVGRWGQVVYNHKLSCGHIDSRKRAATSDEIACMWCLRAEEKDAEIKKLSAPPVQSVFYDDNLAEEETRIEKTRAALAARIGVPMEAVDVAAEDVNGILVIRSAVLYLSARDINRITGET